VYFVNTIPFSHVCVGGFLLSLSLSLCVRARVPCKRVDGAWEEAMDEDAVLAMLEESLGQRAGFMSTVGLLHSELYALTTGPSAVAPLPSEWPAFKHSLSAFLADLLGACGTLPFALPPATPYSALLTRPCKTQDALRCRSGRWRNRRVASGW
jgi:hypothetical protein